MKNKISYLDYLKIRFYAKTHLDKKRFIHSKEVGKIFYVLTGGNYKKKDCMALGFFHDITRNLKKEDMLKLIPADMQIFEGEEESTDTLHAIASASLFEKKFPHVDKDYVEGLRFHTCPKMRMSEFAINFYVADKIDCSRTHISDEFRKKIIQIKDVEKRAFLILDMSKKYLQSKNKTMTSETEKLYKSLKDRYVEL